MFILVLAAGRGILRRFLIPAMAAVVIMLLIQHTHYSIDILGALVFTPVCWKVSGMWWKALPAAAALKTQTKPA
jgi:hypothetical protein